MSKRQTGRILVRRVVGGFSGTAGLLLVACVTLGCEKHPQSASSTPAQSQTAPKQVPPDHSPSSAEFISIGMPEPDRTWTGADMKRAQAIVSKLASESPEKLPRFRSGKSGELFARIFGSDNLSFHRNKTLPIQTRLSDQLEYMDAYSSMLKQYYAAFLSGKVASRDVIEILCGMMNTVAMTVELVDEFLPMISKDAPDYEQRMNGLKQMKQGLSTTVAGTLTVLTERQAYPVADRLALIDNLRVTLPKILPSLSDNARLETETRLGALCKDPALEELRPAICELHDQISEPPK